jgi:hypothetical protein
MGGIADMMSAGDVIGELGAAHHHEYSDIFSQIVEKGVYFNRDGKEFTLSYAEGPIVRGKDVIDMISPIYTNGGRDVRGIVKKNYCDREGSKNILVNYEGRDVGIVQFYHYDMLGKKILHTKMFASDPIYRGGVLKFLKGFALLSSDFDVAVIASGIPRVMDTLEFHYQYYNRRAHGPDPRLESLADDVCEGIGIPLHPDMIVYSTDLDDIYSVGQVGKENSGLHPSERLLFISDESTRLRNLAREDIVSFLEK